MTNEHNGIIRAIHAVEEDVEEGNALLADILTALAGQGHSLNGFIATINGRRFTHMANIPVPQLLDVEKITLSVMPRKADGHVDAAAVITWTSSDTSQVGVNVGTGTFDFTDPQNGNEVVTCPGAFNCEALTPLSSGTATVTASCSGYEDAVFGPITYAPGVPRSLNGSVGLPVSDL